MKTPYSEIMAEICLELDIVNMAAEKLIAVDADPRKIYKLLGIADGLCKALKMIQPLHDDYIMNNNTLTVAQ